MSFHAESRTAAALRAAAAAWLGASMMFFFAAPAAAQRMLPDDSSRQPLFTVSESNEAFHILTDAEKLLAAGRTADAMEKISAALDRYASRLIKISVNESHEIEAAKEGKSWFSTWQLVVQRLEAQPAAVRDDIERVDGPRARAQFDAALQAKSVAELTAVYRRFPWTRAGGDALVSLAGIVFEQGNVEEALALWKRAALRTDRSKDPDLMARIALVEAALQPSKGVVLPPGAPLDAPVEIEGRSVPLGNLTKMAPEPLGKAPVVANISNSTAALPPDPGKLASGIQWRKELEMAPQPHLTPWRPILPVIAGDAVYVSNHWSLAAFDRSTGVPLWRDIAVARGWNDVPASQRDDFVDAENPNTLAAPAVGNGIVVAPLLVPRSSKQAFTFQQIPVYRPMPYRKLHAFDAATGAPIWDHWHPETAARSSEFVDQYFSAAPAVIAGDRVIMPAWTVPDDATPSLFLTAWDLRTGRELWRTYIVTGQRPVNMFGRSLYEYFCSPACVDGDRIYLSSDLGVMASVDLTTGLVAWLHRYNSKEQPFSGRSPSSRAPSPTWMPSPPIAVGEYVVFTPTDSDFLYVVDRTTGLEVARPIRAVSPDPAGARSNLPPVQHALGVVQNTLFLSGRGVVAIDLPKEPGDPLRFRAVSPSSTWLQRTESESHYPRAALTKNAVLFPGDDGIAVLDREDLRLREVIPYRAAGSGSGGRELLRDSYSGHLCVSEGVILSVSNPTVAAFFDANEIVASARRSSEASPRDASLRERLARSLLGRGRVRARARDYGAALEDFRDADAAITDVSGFEDLRASIALSRGVVYDARGDGEEAAKAYEIAFDAARDGQLRREAGLSLERRLPPSASARREKLVARLEQDFGEVVIDTKELGRVSLSLFLCVRKADALSASNPTAAVAAWQDAILRFADQWIAPAGSGATTISRYARDRIAELIQTHGRGIYSTIESQARKRLEELGARATPEQLDTFAQLFPNSDVAADAACLRLESLMAQGAHDRVPYATYQFLQINPPAASRARALRNCAAALRKMDNEAFAALMDAAAGEPSSPASRAASAPKPSTRGPVGKVGAFSSSGRLLVSGWVNPYYNDGSAGDLLLAYYYRNGEMSVKCVRADAREGDDIAWDRAVSSGTQDESSGRKLRAIKGMGVSIAHGVAAFCDGESVVGVRISDGVTAFRQSMPDGYFETAVAAGGALVVACRESSEGTIRVKCYDAVGGSIAWETSFDVAGGPFEAVASDSEVAFLPEGTTQPRSCYRVALATGESLATVMLPADWTPSNNQRGALYGDMLIYVDHPFRLETNDARVIALNLADGGNKAWELSTNKVVGNGMRTRVVLYGEKEIYVLRQWDAYKETRPQESVLIALDPKTGNQRTIARFPMKMQQFGGVAPDSVVQHFRAPLLVAYTNEDSSTRIDVAELRTGRVQTRTLPGGILSPPPPAIGDKIVGIGHCPTTRAPGSALPQSELRLFNRDTLEYVSERAFSLDSRAVDTATTPSAFVVITQVGNSEVRRIHRFLSDEKEK